jgi:hypothetical protein
MKLVPVSAWVFKVIINSFYFVMVPLRKYTKSVMWYVPYFTHSCRFERSNVEKFVGNPPEISREFITKINTYARKNILRHIKV